MRTAARTAVGFGIGGRAIEDPASEAARSLEAASGVAGSGAAFLRRSHRAMQRGDCEILARAVALANADAARARRVAHRSAQIARQDAAIDLGLRR